MSKLILNVIWYAGSAAHTSLSLPLRMLAQHIPPVWQSPFCSPVRLKPYSTCSPVLHSLSVQSSSPTAFLMPVKLPLVPNWELLTITVYTKLTHCLHQADSLSTPSWLTIYTKLTHRLYQADISVVLLWMVQICWWCPDTYPSWLAASVTLWPSWEQVSYLLPVIIIYCFGYKLLQW